MNTTTPKNWQSLVVSMIFSIIAVTAHARQPLKKGIPCIQNIVVYDTLEIKKFKQQYTRENIRIFPNPSNGIIHVNSINKSLKEIQFYVFDLEGTMIENVRLVGKERKKIRGLKKGTYLYDVFNNDESIERGKIVVK